MSFPDISFKNAKFNMVSGADDLRHIRWGVFEGADGTPKIAAFMVPLLEAHFAHHEGKDIVAESDAVIETLEAKAGPPRQAYEWQCGEFVPVDPQEQRWFKFS